MTKFLYKRFLEDIGDINGVYRGVRKPLLRNLRNAGAIPGSTPMPDGTDFERTPAPSLGLSLNLWVGHAVLCALGLGVRDDGAHRVPRPTCKPAGPAQNPPWQKPALACQRHSPRLTNALRGWPAARRTARVTRFPRGRGKPHAGRVRSPANSGSRAGPAGGDQGGRPNWVATEGPSDGRQNEHGSRVRVPISIRSPGLSRRWQAPASGRTPHAWRGRTSKATRGSSADGYVEAVVWTTDQTATKRHKWSKD